MTAQVQLAPSLDAFEAKCVTFHDGGRKCYGVVVKGVLYRLPSIDGRNISVNYDLDQGLSLTLVRQPNVSAVYSTIKVEPTLDPMIMAAISALSNGDRATPFQVLLHLNTR